MARVVGVGGIFFKSANPEALRAWYRDHLGIDIQDWGGAVFPWGRPDGMTVLNIFPESTGYFAPSQAPFMVNFIVEDLERLLGELRAEGCQVDPKLEASEYGKFGWVMDPEGRRIELWQPPDAAKA